MILQTQNWRGGRREKKEKKKKKAKSLRFLFPFGGGLFFLEEVSVGLEGLNTFLEKQFFPF